MNEIKRIGAIQSEATHLALECDPKSMSIEELAGGLRSINDSKNILEDLRTRLSEEFILKST